MAGLTRRIALTIEYDGTDFAGFQTQGRGERTVQSVLNAAVCKLTSVEDTVVHPAGRTDSGVHALGQVVHFDTQSALPTERLIAGLNALLPRDVSVRDIRLAEPRFHARFSATKRTYVYGILTRPQRSAIWDRYSLLEAKPLDLGLMRSGAAMLEGTHDFRSFANSGGNPGSTTVRRIDRLSIRRAARGEMVLVVLSANAFLRAMVRNTIGALLEVGKGNLEPQELRAILECADREKNPCPTVAAKGLCLLKVDYAASGESVQDEAASDEEG